MPARLPHEKPPEVIKLLRDEGSFLEDRRSGYRRVSGRYDSDRLSPGMKVVGRQNQGGLG